VTTKGVSERPLTRARQTLALDRQGLPVCRDNGLLAHAVAIVAQTQNEDAITEILVDGFFGGSQERFEENIAPQMLIIHGRTFEMGTPGAESKHYCGESPSHLVELSPYAIAHHSVTNELFSRFDRTRMDIPARDRQKPVVNVTWYEAFIFALWMGCRLPTEAEWEFACGAGSTWDWCCADERRLPHHAWYSENARGEVRTVGTREPNALGLFDLHGNVWEWCLDIYDADYYRASPPIDPVCIVPGWPGGAHKGVRHNVCRGGSVHALAEMCRTRYRLHEPADFSAADLGFRLAAGVTPSEAGHLA
jgi:formylglycine-generating enzyme required for sulfatase activity